MGDKDIVSKDLLRRIAIDIARLLLHLKVDRAEIVETEYQRIEDRRADLVAREVVHYVLERLRELTGDDTRRFREYVNVLEILSTNRNLQGIIKEEEKMLSEVDRTQLPSYCLGMEQGKLEGEAQALHRLLEKRFGPLPAEVLARIASASVSHVEAWFDRAIDAGNLTDVFGPMAH